MPPSNIVRNALEHQDPGNATFLQSILHSDPNTISVRSSVTGNTNDIDSNLRRSNSEVLPKPIRGVLDTLTDTLTNTFTDFSRHLSSSEDQQEVLRRHRDSLRAQLEAKAKSYDDLKGELKDCQTLLGQTIDSERYYRREHNDLQAKLIHYRSEYDKTHTKWKKFAEDIKSLRDNAAYQADRAEKLKAGCFQLEEQVKDEKAKKDKLQAENNYLGTVLGTMQEQLQIYQKKLVESEEARKLTEELLIRYQQQHDMKLNEIEAIWRSDRASGGEMLEAIKASIRDEDFTLSSQPSQLCSTSFALPPPPPPPPDHGVSTQSENNKGRELFTAMFIQKEPQSPDPFTLETSTNQACPPPVPLPANPPQPATPTQIKAPPLPTPMNTPPSNARPEITNANGKPINGNSNTPNRTPAQKKRPLHDNNNQEAKGLDKRADQENDDDDDPIVHPTKRARRSTAKSR